MTTDIGQWLAP